MKKGQTVEHGSHDQLYDMRGTYREIFDASARSLNIEKLAMADDGDEGWIQRCEIIPYFRNKRTFCQGVELFVYSEMEKAEKPKPLKCPCCGELRPESECCVFISQIAHDVPNKYYGTLDGDIIGNLYWLDAQKGKVDWACDNCLKQYQALRGKTKRQLFCGTAPHFAYFDKRTICRDCGMSFIFSKEQQVHYYEKLVFWVQAERVRCDLCQSLKKTRNQLSHLLANPDYNNLEQVKEVIAIRIVLKQYRQAKHFLAVAKRNQVTESISYLIFELLKKQIAEAELTDNSAER
ncbi:zinc-ribbon domain containing protein [Hymenobacter sp. IS2118]|uniref:zinc-ribbon domain containing protein n=1 Tax=Hymenobacter sp. IS2118 TaxID=1505605 RepID=UPI0012693B2F|nr:zinc-ribbon domain containing protein [Hymenobacter sp. IS2118]